MSRDLEDFYGLCAEILGTEHHYRDGVPRSKVDRETGKSYFPSTRATRWGGREPGNGRFPGFGLIRFFWPETVQINLYYPKKLSATIVGKDKALAFLRKNLE